MLKKFKQSKKFKQVAAVVALSAVAVAAAPKAKAAGGIIDLNSVGTDGLAQVQSGGSAATPIFGGMIAIGLVTAAFRRVAH